MKSAHIRLYDIPVIWLLIYFSGKLLFDEVPYLFELVSLAMIAIYTVAWLVCEGPYTRHKLTLVSIFVVFCVYVIVNALLQCTRQELFRAIYEYAVYTCMFFAMSYLLPKADLTKCLSAFLLWGVIIAGLSWVEYFTQTYIVSDIQYNIGYAGFRATVFSRSYLSHGTLLGIFSLVGMGLFYIQKKVRWVLAAVFCYAAILTTASRGPLVAAGFALVCQFMLNAYISKKYSKKRFGASILLIAAILVVIVIVFGTFTTGNETIDYFLYRIRSIVNWNGDAGNLGRLQIWAQSIDWFKTNVLFGIGPSKTGSWSEATIGVTESGVLKRLCELGIVGVTIYYFFVFIILKKGIRSYRAMNAASKKNMLPWIGIIIAIMINDCTLQVTEEIMVSFFMFTALAEIDVAEASRQ